MTDLTQILLISVVTILTILLVVVGTQVFYILKEFKKTVEKINKILDDAGVASGTIAESLSGLSGVTAGLRTILSVFGLFKKEKKNGETG
jgi:hypothetical protein